MSIVCFFLIGGILLFYNFIFKSYYHHDIFLNSIFNFFTSLILFQDLFLKISFRDGLYIITLQSAYIYLVSSYRKVMNIKFNSPKLRNYIIRKDFFYLKSLHPIIFNFSIILSQIYLGYNLLFSKFSIFVALFSFIFHFFSLYLTNRGRIFHFLFPLSIVALSHINNTHVFLTSTLFIIYFLISYYFMFSKRFSLFIKYLCI